MIEQILTEAARSGYDFRDIAAPEDSLQALWPEWVDYYKLKFAIARMLQPRWVLEVGVRFGYSAHAFAMGAGQGMTYLGIDDDSGRAGGQVGALDYARALFSPSRFCARCHVDQIQHGIAACVCPEGPAAWFEFLQTDSQLLASWPRHSAMPANGLPIYDLIHLDGEQTQEAWATDINKSMTQGRYVLLDGYVWTSANFDAINNLIWVHTRKKTIAWMLMIPGYAGELLIRTTVP